MSDDGGIPPKSWPFADMPRGGKEPQSAMLCVLEITNRDQRLGFEYSNIIRFDVEGRSIAKTIELARCGQIEVDHRPLEASGTRPSRLSLANDGLDYVVFVLGDSMANLEFSKDRPFSRAREASGCAWPLGLLAARSSAPAGIFGEPTRLDARTAFFISDNTRPGVHWFNIHLDVLDDEGFGPIPIIIDPDIGHPGGRGGRRQ